MTTSRWTSLAASLIVTLSLAPAARSDPGLRSKRGRLAGSLQLGTGFRGIFPFHEEYCGEDDPAKSYCVGRSPLTLGLGGAYGVTRSLAVLLSIDVGLEPDFGPVPGADGPHAFAFATGLKMDLAPLGGGELSATLELLLDATGYDQVDSSDVGVRNRNAWEFPLGRNLGGQLYFGETASWLRWFRFELDVGVGVVARI